MHLSDDSLMRDFAAACDVVEKVMRKRDIVEGGTGYGWSLPLELIEPDPAMLEAARQSALAFFLRLGDLLGDGPKRPLTAREVAERED